MNLNHGVLRFSGNLINVNLEQRKEARGKKNDRKGSELVKKQVISPRCVRCAPMSHSDFQRLLHRLSSKLFAFPFSYKILFARVIPIVTQPAILSPGNNGLLCVVMRCGPSGHCPWDKQRAGWVDPHGGITDQLARVLCQRMGTYVSRKSNVSVTTACAWSKLFFS